MKNALSDNSPLLLGSAQITETGFKNYLHRVIPMIYSAGGLLKGLREVKLKRARMKVLIISGKSFTTRYATQVKQILKQYSGPILALPDRKALSKILEKQPLFNCGIAGIVHFPKQISMEFQAYLNIYNLARTPQAEPPA